MSVSFTRTGAHRLESAGSRVPFGLGLGGLRKGWLRWVIPSFSWKLCFLGGQPTLAGFDFPIGLPEQYGRETGFDGFCQALPAFGTGCWSAFYDVADFPGEITRYRPFYPRRGTSGARQLDLITALGASSIEDLKRRCEQTTGSRRAACSLFWTLGANQVGKAAISGWKEVVSPALQRGAKLWPFDGPLAALVHASALTIAETYPAEAYAHVGSTFAAGEGKRRQRDRARIASDVRGWSRINNVTLAPTLGVSFDSGFGPRADGEDAFDAVMGLLSMIEVADSRRAEGPAQSSPWEGWILGQCSEKTKMLECVEDSTQDDQ
jgi:hypothetical protein